MIHISWWTFSLSTSMIHVIFLVNWNIKQILETSFVEVVHEPYSQYCVRMLWYIGTVFVTAKWLVILILQEVACIFELYLISVLRFPFLLLANPQVHTTNEQIETMLWMSRSIELFATFWLSRKWYFRGTCGKFCFYWNMRPPAKRP